MIDDWSATTPEEMEKTFARSVRSLRLLAGWKQSTLSERAGVSLPTLRRYERTGKTSLLNFFRICHALGQLDVLAGLLEPPAARSLDELEKRGMKSPNRRGRR